MSTLEDIETDGEVCVRERDGEIDRSEREGEGNKKCFLLVFSIFFFLKFKKLKYTNIASFLRHLTAQCDRLDETPILNESKTYKTEMNKKGYITKLNFGQSLRV